MEPVQPQCHPATPGQLSSGRLQIPPPLQVPACSFHTGEIFHNPCCGSQALNTRGQNLAMKTWNGSSLLLVELRLVPHTHVDKEGLTPVMASPTDSRPGPGLGQSPSQQGHLAGCSSLCTAPPLVPSTPPHTHTQGHCVTMGTVWVLESLVLNTGLSLTIRAMLGRSCNHPGLH